MRKASWVEASWAYLLQSACLNVFKCTTNPAREQNEYEKHTCIRV